MSVIVDRLTVRFGDRTVLDHASASFSSGRLTAIVGPSGSGKSTLLSAISGGEVALTGSVSASGHIEWLVQSTPLFQRRTSIDNVIASAVFRGAPRRLAILRGLRALRSIGIMHLSRSLTYQLSGGEKQRVAVARAIASKADIVLADEPTASLDAVSRERVCDALQAASDAGATVIIATHDPYVAARCDTVYTLSGGALRKGLDP